MSDANRVVGWKYDTGMRFETFIGGSLLLVSFELSIPETEISGSAGNFVPAKGSISSVPFVPVLEMRISCVHVPNNLRGSLHSVEQKASVFVRYMSKVG